MRLLPLFLLLTVSVFAAPQHTILLKEAAVAAQAGDPATALTKLEAAAKLRPDYPRVQLNLARFYVEAKRPAEALTALQRLVDMGVTLAIARDSAFTPLQESPVFKNLATRLATPPAPVGNMTAVPLEGVTGILESVLLDPGTGAWYFGDVRNRCIWRRGPDGVLGKFTSDADALDGVFNLALSPDRRTLWASTAVVSAMAGTPAEEGSRAALVAIDPATGRVTARHPAPADGRKHLLGDFLVAPDGSLFATDSLSPVIWRLPAGGTALEPWLESDDFINLQGLAFAPDGQTLYVADYSNGLWRLDVATKQPALLVAPPNASFFGIDGLYAVPGGLLAIQNGMNPQRVLHVSPAAEGQPTRAHVVALAHPAMTDLALGTIDGTRFHFIADSGWSLFDPPPEKMPAPRTVTVLSLTIE